MRKLGCTIRCAREDDLSERIGIVMSAYRKLGYVSDTSGENVPIAFSPLHPKNLSLVAVANNHIVGTVTAVRDGTCELSVEKEFPDHIRTLRATVGEGNFAYIERLTVADEFRDGRVTKLFFALLFLWSIVHVRAVVAIVNPRHKYFYTSKGFTEIGFKESVSSAGVHKAPAVLIIREVSIHAILHGIGAWALAPLTRLVRSH